MYSPELENLINIALTDGTITDKERQILMRKAESLGIDLDEFEMVLESRIYEKEQSMKHSAPTEQEAPAPPPPPPVAAPTSPAPGPAQEAAPKTNKFGDLKKCPSCGSQVGAMDAICRVCGHEFMNVDSVGSVQRLHAELTRAEEEERNRPKEQASGIRSLTSLIQGDNDPMEAMNLQRRIFQRKASVLSTFPVPNSKADIIEFMSMAVAEGSKKIGLFSTARATGEGDYIKAWRTKAEQVVMKARFSLREDKALLEELNYYAKQLDIK
jgi:hypothetical protein